MSITGPHVLREYALLADGERGAVIGPHGDVAWLCAPRWDSGSVFSTLAGGGGTYAVTPRGRFVWGGYYESNSLIWHSRWVTGEGIVECREALAYPGDPHRLVLLRSVHPLDCPGEIDVLLRPRADYDRRAMGAPKAASGIWTFRCGPLYMRWTCGPGARHRDGAFALRLDLEPGERRELVLEISDERLPDEPVDPATAWRATEAAWEDAVPTPKETLAPRDTAHSIAVLHGLTSSRGGMVAAATTSLPERSDAGRNYDYRYVWIRDQCFAGQAAAAVDSATLLDAAVGFVSQAVREHGAQLAPAYTVTGERIPAQRRLGLPGYPGGSDIVGNQAGNQFQLDAFGEALLLFATADRAGRLDADAVRAAEITAAAIGKRWREPDAGIWELDNHPWTHSRLVASAGLRAMAAAPSGRGNTQWLALADRLLADTAANALHPDGYWQRAADDPTLDASLLLAQLRGATTPDDPRAVATLHAYLRDLTVDGYAYRYRHDSRPLPEAEGSFLLCGFLVALALHEQRSPVEARAWFERTRAATGPPELFSEEYDCHQHQMRGNLPQAFVHALMIQTAARLGKETGDASDT
jgi:hypothetical protein